MRDLVAKMKLIPVRRLIEGRRLMLLDDSIVRGTQLKEQAQLDGWLRDGTRDAIDRLCTWE